jgi:hypothetical protein
MKISVNFYNQSVANSWQMMRIAFLVLLRKIRWERKKLKTQISEEFSLMDGRIFIRAIFDNFVGFCDHLSDLRELLLPIGVLSMGFDFILSGSLEGIRIHIGIFAISE